MMNGRTFAICAVGIALLGHRAEGQDLSRYRTFELGSAVASISTLTGVASSEIKTIHQRPALMQDLAWRPSRWVSGSSMTSTDPVDQVLFSFYNDQLFRVVVDYGHDRTEGMTDADMIEAISTTYGAPLAPTLRAAVRSPSRVETESGSLVARWGDAEHAVVLYRTSSYGRAMRLIVTKVTLDDVARKAEAQAMRLDDQEAPRREIARQKKEREDGLDASEKARVTNKAVFRP
jgi:GGDEF domain-containing protein